MAEVAVLHLLSNFTPFIQDKYKLFTGVGEEIEYIRDEFEHMTAFLQVADANIDNDAQLKVWVRQVREVANDTGDVLEQFIFRLENHHSTGAFYGLFQKAYFFLTTFKVRYQLATEIREIKSRMRNILQGYETYHKMYSNTQQGSNSDSLRNKTWYDSRGDALLLEEDKIVGIKGPKSEIINWLLDENPSLQVISVVGMGGLGKTTLVKKIFDDGEMRKHFQSLSWITISESFNIQELMKSMIKQLLNQEKKPIPPEVEGMDLNNLKAVIYSILHKKRYVIVLDDIWDVHAWQGLRCAFPDCNYGSRVIITTRIADIASLACNEYPGKVYNLLSLPEDESWTLFCKKAFHGNSCPSHLEEVSRNILRRCEGLPLAIVTIGGLLSTKGESIEEWQMIQRGIGAELEANDKLQTLKRILLLSYFHLPFYLKSCFLYLSIYPEDYQIDHGRLIRLWVSEGFAQSKQGRTAEEVAANYLTELLNRNLILVAVVNLDGKIKAYHIHDILREIITNKSIEHNHTMIVNKYERSCADRMRRLSIHNLPDNWQQSIASINKLRSLAVLGPIDEKSTLFLVSSLSHGARLLKVLDLRGSPLVIFPSEVAKLLHLKYLSLRGSRITIIPKSIGNLQMLETLDLTDTLVTELPKEILKLHRLRHLLVYRYLHEVVYRRFHSHIGFRAPKGIGNLKNLQKLCSIELGQGIYDKTIVGEIGKLTQLRRLSILQVKSENGREICSSLQKLTNLRSLSICAANENEIINLEPLHSPPQFVRTLHIIGKLEKFPHWIPLLQNVVKVYLRCNKAKGELLKPLEDLPNLASLYLVDTYEGKSLSFKYGKFRRLKRLGLVSLTRLKRVEIVEGAMPQLEILNLYDCALVEELPYGLEYLSRVKEFRLIDMPIKVISKLRRDEPRIAHIPKVWIGQAYDGTYSGHFL